MNVFRAVANAWDAFWGGKSYWSAVGGGRKTTSQEVVSEDSALNYSAVWCATRLLCGTGAALPLPIFKGLEDEQRVKDRKHPVYKLLNVKPNPETTAFNFRSVMWQWQINWGNAYAEIQREGDNPEGELMWLWPLHPSRVTMRRRDDADMSIYYEVVNEFGNDKAELEPWQMLHIPSTITSDGIYGRGVIENARESIGAGIAAEKYGANWFGGAAVPRVVIEHQQNWPKEARDAFRQEWEEIHGGPNGHRVAVLGGGATAKPLSLSAEDSQFLETRQFGVEEIARWYGIPPFLLQHLLNATLNNVEELGSSFVSYSLAPWLEVWEQCISQKLLVPNEDTYFAEHNVDALKRGNIQARAQFYQAMTSAALMTRNEVRRLENLPTVEGGDTFLVQGATVPLDDDGKPQSEFAGTAAGSQAAPDSRRDVGQSDQPSDQQQDGETDATTLAISSVAASIHRVISHDLSRFLTKETKAMANYAKKPGEFLPKVDAFYADHRQIVRDEVQNTFDALIACGHRVCAEQFVSSWAEEGRSLMVEASSVLPEQLAEAVERVTASKTWSERPERAIERVKNGQPA